MAKTALLLIPVGLVGFVIPQNLPPLLAIGTAGLVLAVAVALLPSVLGSLPGEDRR
jgi:hypothetical protein